MTDAYQPGRMIFFPDLAATGDVVVRSGADLAATTAHGSEIVILPAEPGPAWHSRLSGSGTGSPLASGNLPEPRFRGLLQQSEHYRWFSRNTVQAAGPVGRRADLQLTGTGQWAAQTVPQARIGADLDSRLLQATGRSRVQPTSLDQLDGHFAASLIRLSDWGIPAGLEALQGRRLSPPLDPPSGFSGLREADNLGALHAGWTRQMPGAELVIRYGFSAAGLDTFSSRLTDAPARIDLVDGVRGGAPPLANRAARTRHEVLASYDPGERTIAGRRHRLVLGGNLERAAIRNRWSAPFNLNLVTANAAPASVVELNTPLENRSRIWAGSVYARDDWRFASWLTASVSLVGDYSRAGPIAWTSASPRVWLRLAPMSRLTLLASYGRPHSPLAGRYLDYGDNASLGGQQFRWIDRNGDGNWQPSEKGNLQARFGAPYSAIDARLSRPYADEFNAGADARLPGAISASLRLFRRDEKRRIAAVNVGVPAAAFSPVEILDPGADGMPGTFDDQTLTVYAQDPSTLGRDRYLLTNPPGLRMLHEGMITEVGRAWGMIQAHASFMAVKAFGATNPGNGALENDGGVVGSLFQDPNTLVSVSGRTYFDRAYVGKAQITATLPGRLDLANTFNYLDGLVFGRRILVTGLPQGSFLLAATVRGSPEGGNRTEYILNWNLRMSRAWRAHRGNLRLSLDVLNVLNAANKTREVDASGPLFNLRLPVTIQSPRFARINMEFSF